MHTMQFTQFNWHNNNCVTTARSCELGHQACARLCACGMLRVNYVQMDEKITKNAQITKVTQ